MNVLCVCPHCEHKYTLGIDGTVEGCDVCLNIIRNPLDNTIIDEPDTLTSPENS